MKINVLALRDHAFGSVVVAFVSSICTMMMAYLARVGPEQFSLLTMAFGVVTMVALAASAVMTALLIYKQD